jgi:hypothetical protein
MPIRAFGGNNPLLVRQGDGTTRIVTRSELDEYYFEATTEGPI